MKLLRAYPDVATAWRHLAEYLGDGFDPELTRPPALRPFLDAEWARLHPDFYQRSTGYLYDLTLFHYSGVKDGFFQTLTGFTALDDLTRIADVGCGVGLDAQALLQRGYDVHGYDLENPCLDYARWRVGHELGAPERIRELSGLPGRWYDLVYAVDVLGHASSPSTLIDLLFDVGDHVMVNLLPHDPIHRFGPEDLHPGLDHARILPLFNSRGELIRLAASGESVVAIWKSTK